VFICVHPWPHKLQAQRRNQICVLREICEKPFASEAQQSSFLLFPSYFSVSLCLRGSIIASKAQQIFVANNCKRSAQSSVFICVHPWPHKLQAQRRNQICVFCEICEKPFASEAQQSSFLLFP
jgi:hypothetical protein